MIFPSVVAGSIFTFSLSLGDYIAVQIVGGKTQMLGNLGLRQRQRCATCPFAAALATVPVVDHGRLPARGAPHRRAGEPLSCRRVTRCPDWCWALRGWSCSGSRSSTCRCWSSCSTRSTPTGRSPGRPSGFTLDWWSRALGQPGRARRRCGSASRSALGATALALVLGTLASFALQRYRVLRPRRHLAADRAADRAARHRHRHRAQQRPSPPMLGVDLGVLHGRRRPRDVLHRGGLQQRRRPAAPARRERSRRRRWTSAPTRFTTFRLRHLPAAALGAARRRTAGLRAVASTRSSSPRSPRAAAPDPADLDLHQHVPARTRRRSSTSSATVLIVASIIPIYLSQKLSGDATGGRL